MNFLSRQRVLAVGLLMSFLGAKALGQADPAGLEVDKQSAKCVVSVSSMSGFKKLLAGWGMADLPPTVSPEGLAEALPVIDADAIDTERPIGVIHITSPGLAMERDNRFVIAYPVKPGKATTEAMIAKGAKPIPGMAGMVKVDDRSVRRMKDYVIFSPAAEVLAVTKEADLAGLHKSADGRMQEAAVRLTIDMGGLKRVIGREAMREAISDGPAPTDGAERAGYDLAQNFILDLDRFDISLQRIGGNTRLRTLMSPLKVGKGSPEPMPELPGTPVLRMDIAGDSLPQLRASMVWMKDVLVKDDPKAAKEINTSAETLNKWMEGFFSGRALTFGLSQRQNKPVFYLVQQQDAPVDLMARLQAIVKATNDDKDLFGTQDVKFVFEQRNGANGPIGRLNVMVDKKLSFSIDGTAKGKNVYFTAGPDLAKDEVDAVAKLGTKGTMSTLISGYLVMGPLVDTLALMEPDLKDLTAAAGPAGELLKDFKLNFAVQGEANGMVLDLEIADDLIKRAISTP